MNCNICGRPAEPLFTTRVLGRHEVTYHRCGRCGFIQTDEPFWLAEAYKDAINIYDVWAVSRPIHDCEMVVRLIDRCFAGTGLPFLDFGGGHGIFTRRMRDKGYPFLRSDTYTPNLYARCFDVTDYPRESRFALIACFEVFEHLPDPIKELRALFELADTVVFSTNIAPAGLKKEGDWNYFAPYHGQHVSFYTVAALEELAAATGSRLYTDRLDHHLLTRANLRLTQAQFVGIASGHPSNRLRRLLQKAGNALLRLSRPRSQWKPRESLTFADFNRVCEITKKEPGFPENKPGVMD